MNPIKNANVAVVGGREFTDRTTMFYVLDKYNEHFGINSIVSGGARGADTLAEVYAHEKQISLVVYPAEWDKYGKKAGFIRNVTIAENCDVVIAFPTDTSKGTWHTITIAKKMNKPVYVFEGE